MNTNSKKFTDDIADLRKFLADRKLLGELALRSGAKSRTVQYALSSQSEDELKGKKLAVYKEALALRQEIEDLFCDYKNNENISDAP